MASEGSEGLVRGLEMWAATAVVVGAMIGQSVFLVASDMAREVDSLMKVIVVWIAGGVIVLCGASCYAELGAAMPEAGGDYLYLGRGLSPVWGFLYGWTSTMIMQPGTSALIAAGLIRFVAYLSPAVSEPLVSWDLQLTLQSPPFHFAFTRAQLLAALVVILVTALNYFGVRTVGTFQVVLTALKVGTIAVILILGLSLKTIPVDQVTALPNPSHGPLVSFLIALVPVMAAYNGFQNLGAVAGEIYRPEKSLPRAVILGTALVMALYIGLNWVYFQVLSFSQVARSQNVASEVVANLVGISGARWFTLAMVVSAFGSIHAGLLTGPRVAYAMARDRHFFAIAGRLHPRFRTPSGAVIFQGCIATILVLSGTYQELYSYSMFAVWSFLGLTSIALIRLRIVAPKMPRPFRLWGYPWIPLGFGVAAFAIALNLWLVRPVRSSIGLALIAAGIPFFHYWRRKTGVPNG
jgi:APA family basic amino acid/polyamine antiporter